MFISVQTQPCVSQFASLGVCLFSLSSSLFCHLARFYLLLRFHHSWSFSVVLMLLEYLFITEIKLLHLFLALLTPPVTGGFDGVAQRHTVILSL